MLPNDALTAAVIGGLLTGLGTLLGALLIRWLDIGRDDRKVRRQITGAINAVLAEMAGNDARLTTQVEHQQWFAVELGLSTSVYRRVELILAEHLDVETQGKLFEAYAPIEGGDFYDIMATTTPTGITTTKLGLDLKQCAELIELIGVASTALRKVRDHKNARPSLRRLFALRRPHPNAQTAPRPRPRA